MPKGAASYRNQKMSIVYVRQLPGSCPDCYSNPTAIYSASQGLNKLKLLIDDGKIFL